MEYLFLALAIFAVMAIWGLVYGRSPLWIRPKRPKLTFENIVGYEPQKEILMTSIRQLLDSSLPASALTRSILLYGPRGIGKKALAAASAGSGKALGKLCYYEVNCANLVCNPEAEAAITHILKAAQKHQPSIILFAGIESLVDADHEDLLALIREGMDALADSAERVLVLGAASLNENAAESLDMFSAHVAVDIPRQKEREEIIQDWLDSGNECSYEISKMANELQGHSFSQILSVLNYAAHLARKDRRKIVGEVDFVNALYFRNQAAVDADAGDTKTFYHEAGHCVVSALQNIMILRSSAYPVTGRQGFTKAYLPEDDAVTARTQFSFLVSTLAGRAAEEVIFGDENISGGSLDDLLIARKMCKSFLLDYGFGSTLSGCATECEVDDLLQNALELARSMLADHRQELEDIVRLLTQNGTITGTDVLRVLYSDLYYPPRPTEEELAELFGEDDFDPDTYMID